MADEPETDPEIKRLRADRARQERIREAAALRDAGERAEKTANEARKHLAGVNKHKHLRETRAAEEKAGRESAGRPSLLERLNQPRSEQRNRGFRKRGEQDREPER